MVVYNEEDLRDHNAVGACIRDENGRILMLMHKKWGFRTIPIGKAHPGQTPEEGIRMELQEECGIEATHVVPIMERQTTYMRENREVRLNLIVFDVLEYKGTIYNSEPEKHDSLGYMSIEEIANEPYISDITVLMLEKFGIIRAARI